MRLKIPQGAYRRAKERKILRQVAYMLELKTILPSHGFLSNKDINDLPDHLGCRRTIKRNLSACISANLIKRTRHGYRLVSFDALCQELGYDLSESKTTRNRIRRGSFKIHRIPLDRTPDIKMVDIMAKLDLQDNLKSQVKAAYTRYRQDLLNDHKVPLKRAGHAEMTDRLNTDCPEDVYIVKSSQIAKEKLQEHDVLSSEKYLKGYANLDITLSCEGFGRILGVCKQSAWGILNRLTVDGIITWTKRSVYKCEVSEKYSSITQALKELDFSRYHIYRGSIFYNMPNKIKII